MDDVKALAKQLAAMGRNGDTMLAHITPEEAALLKEMGGSGTINPHTGLPEFFGIGSIFKPLKHIASGIASATKDIPGINAFTAPLALAKGIKPFTSELQNNLLPHYEIGAAIGAGVTGLGALSSLMGANTASSLAASGGSPGFLSKLGSLFGGGTSVPDIASGGGVGGGESGGLLGGLKNILTGGSGGGGLGGLNLGKLGIGALGALVQRKQGEKLASQLEGVTAPARNAANAMLAQYQSGTLNAGDAQAISDYAANAKAAIRQGMASRGLGSSGILDDRLAEVDKQVAAMKSQALANYFTQGINALGSTYGPYTQALQQRFMADTQARDTLTNVFGDVFGSIGEQLGGTLGGGTGKTYSAGPLESA